MPTLFRALISLATALVCALVIALYLITPENEFRSLDVNLLIGTASFVVPFTLVGSFGVVWTSYSFAKRRLTGATVDLAVVAISTIAGAAMLVGLSSDTEEALLGGISGGMTSAVWLLLVKLFSPREKHD